MIQIPVATIDTPDGPLLSPASPFPVDAVVIVCDGTTYTVYQPGDTVPVE